MPHFRCSHIYVTAALTAGGSGFLGRRLVQHLLDTGNYDVWIFDVMAPSPAIPGAQFITGDLTSPESIRQACVGKNVVFHVATAAPTAQNAASAQALMQAVNVDGTQNVLSACESSKVSRLVVTSSASVVFDGSPLCTVDESLPYADPPLDYYTSTKAQVCSLQACGGSSAGGTHANTVSSIWTNDVHSTVVTVRWRCAGRRDCFKFERTGPLSVCSATKCHLWAR